jgi:hypothetical protein
MAKILEIDKEKKRISLSIKETLEPPVFEPSSEKDVPIQDEYSEKPDVENSDTEEEEEAMKSGDMEAEVAMDSDDVVIDKELEAVTCPYVETCKETDEDFDPEDAHDDDVTVPEEIEAEVDIETKDVVVDKEID